MSSHSPACCADDNEFQQGASRGTVQAMINDKSQPWDLYTLFGDVSYARCALLCLPVILHAQPAVLADLIADARRHT